MFLKNGFYNTSPQYNTQMDKEFWNRAKQNSCILSNIQEVLCLYAYEKEEF
jgi:hypothetical protein